MTNGLLRRPERADVVVVGAGIVGLAHACEALARGRSVVVVERDERAVGASVRNFGHGCVTAQDGTALAYARTARETWVRLARSAGFWLRESGTVVLARAEDEMAVLEEFHALRGDEAVPLDRAGVEARVPAGPDVVGGAWLPMDVRVDPREAVPATAAWLAARGVRFLWGTAALAVEPGLVRTSRGDLAAGHVVVAVGHDVDRHFPEIADEAGLVRCGLQMMRVRGPAAGAVDAAVLSGFSLMKYPGFASCPSLSALRDRLTGGHAELVAAGLNLMLTQRPDGDLTVGDTHTYARTLDPFGHEHLDEGILAQVANLLGTPLTVRERWRGVYASAPGRDFLVATPAPGVRVVSVTSGVGMTTAFGLAPAVLDGLLA
ncbi:FAD-dependent oxidoreductase [Sphaerisporangium siamense]|uniref:FAD dependent oxidoreductase TIGR03364 n=1 Tax=Sphaerisporangium siamense TaxID=795645 RepID=A0A7W7G7A7_9ACTN|nr:TIGR03364 family FAD-dependent oxidoreductase [Sphaerisporangium siamense]MBB4698932.1 FAD dependent oxidoreductase TIGR03364 [Sphaerisporangium siamense]GII88543.1 FAD-dependent oxidoreductase [Sphaerisporangium siamense]